jgi:D-sedoheptulose 7-phosphate isomerase
MKMCEHYKDNLYPFMKILRILFGISVKYYLPLFQNLKVISPVVSTSGLFLKTKQQTMKKQIEKIIQSSVSVKVNILKNERTIAKIEDAAKTISDCLVHGNVWFCGNGGSAADAQHLAAELSGRFYMDRKPLPAEALHCNTSYLTAVANDFGFDKVYSRMIQCMCNDGDVLVAISTSGNSPNIINALKTALKKNLFTIGMTGSSGGKMAQYCDILIKVPSNDTPRIQEAHIMIGHIICQLVEETLTIPE